MSAAKIEQYATIGLMVGMGLLALRLVGGKGIAGAAAGAVGVADDVAGGLVQGVGAVFGVPMTDKSECEKAKAEGRTWDASFVCPAGEWMGYSFGKMFDAVQGKPDLKTATTAGTTKGYVTGGVTYDEMGNVVGGY
jgi:hypothetical protein